MLGIINKFIDNLTIDDVNDFAKKKNIILDSNELLFTFEFVKKNYKEILTNPSLFNFDLYQNKYSKENFIKIKKVLNEYYSKYHSLLKNAF